MDKVASIQLSRRTTYCCLACMAACGVLSLTPSATAERLYSSGFELNSVTDGVEFAVPAPAGLSINSSTVRSGSCSLRQNSLTAGYIEHQWLAADADAHVFIRFYFRVAAFPSITARVLDMVGPSARDSSLADTRASLRLTSIGTLRLFNATAQVGPDSWVLVKDLWHCVEMEYQSLNAAGYDVLQARLDGTPFAASLQQTLGTVAGFRLGNSVTLTGSVPDFYFDDVAINDENGVGENEFPGPGKIVVQSPDVKPEGQVISLGALVEYAPPSMVSAIADDNSTQGRGIQTGDRVVITFDTRTNGYSITSDNVDTVLPLSNSHSWLDSGGRFGGASWCSTKYPNDTLLITLSNTSGTPPSVAAGDYITVGANTIEVTTGGEDLTGSPVRIIGTFTGPWYYHVNSAAALGHVGTAYQDYTNPFPAPSLCWHNISDALNAIKADAHGGPWVVQVDDTATYDESVTILGFKTYATATLTIRKNPALSGRPTVYPTAAARRAFSIGENSQVDGENSYVTIQGFVMSNNVAGTDKSTEAPLFANCQANLTRGQILIEDCVFDGLGQTYDTRNTQMISEFHVDTVFRNNEVKNFTTKRDQTGLEYYAGLIVVDPRNSSIAGGKKVQVVGNSFHDNTGFLCAFVGRQESNWKYSTLYEGNRVYNNKNTDPTAGLLILTEWLNLSNTFINNLFYNNSVSGGWEATLLIYGSGNTKIYHNTFFNNHAGREFVVSMDLPEGGETTDGVEIKNNIFWPTPGGYCIDVQPGCTENLVSANNAFFTDWNNDGYPPGFGFSTTENTEAIGFWNNFAMTTSSWNNESRNNTDNGYTLGGPGLDDTMHLVAGAVCIDRGVSGLVSDDIDGELRPMGAGYDIGADECGATGTAMINSIGMKLVWIHAGEFMMGGESSAAETAQQSGGEAEWYTQEYPRHHVRINQGFWMGAYEVTQREYRAVMSSNPSIFELPVVMVSWEDAQEFCRRLSLKEGKTYRLPTEAEWEYACRAGTTTPFSFGETINTDQANYNGNYPYCGGVEGQYRAKSLIVGSFPPNAFGLYDMHGNVCEWCQDWYGEDYYAGGPEGDPQGPASGAYRVLRGGAWTSDADSCRSACRICSSPDDCYDFIGFRVVCVSAPN